jgi:hypothetical protein
MISSPVLHEKKISQIVFDHPLFASVFEKQVANFQHPTVSAFLPIESNATAALRFEDSRPFILQHSNVYLFTSALNTTNSNFQNSPLIVPTFYNMAIQSLPLAKLYYEIAKQNTVAVAVNLQPDEILELKDSISGFIPLQQTRANEVVITTSDLPTASGSYSIEKGNSFIEMISYNYGRKESILRYADVDDWEGVRSFSTIKELFDTIADENSINSYWKWFVIFAVLFLILEMVVLKFFKN